MPSYSLKDWQEHTAMTAKALAAELRELRAQVKALKDKDAEIVARLIQLLGYGRNHEARVDIQSIQSSRHNKATFFERVEKRYPRYAPGIIEEYDAAKVPVKPYDRVTVW